MIAFDSWIALYNDCLLKADRLNTFGTLQHQKLLMYFGDEKYVIWDVTEERVRFDQYEKEETGKIVWTYYNEWKLK